MYSQTCLQRIALNESSLVLKVNSTIREYPLVGGRYQTSAPSSPCYTLWSGDVIRPVLRLPHVVPSGRGTLSDQCSVFPMLYPLVGGRSIRPVLRLPHVIPWGTLSDQCSVFPLVIYPVLKGHLPLSWLLRCSAKTGLTV